MKKKNLSIKETLISAFQSCQKKDFKKAENDLLYKIKQETNIDTQIWAARSIANVFDVLKLEYSSVILFSSLHRLVRDIFLCSVF